jgi:hypothetical protein
LVIKNDKDVDDLKDTAENDYAHVSPQVPFVNQELVFLPNRGLYLKDCIAKQYVG